MTLVLVCSFLPWYLSRPRCLLTWLSKCL